MPVIGRFAPSPSGRMHLGNLFSAMLAWLSVRSQNGTMVLRIEDLDPDRCRPEYTAQLKEDLRWFGLDWDVEQTQQSLRADAYAAEFQKLEQLGLVYPCYCSRAALHAASAPHASDGRQIYAGTCRTLTAQERAAMKKEPAWRVQVPEETVFFRDGLQGDTSLNLAAECGDFIIRRADGVYAYQLAVVTDDAAAGVNQIVRGRDLLLSTPQQIWLQKTLGFSTPDYCHVPLLTAPDGRRLSKRERDLDMGALRQSCTPEALAGYLAWLSGLLEVPEPTPLSSLVRIFDWKKVKTEDICLSGIQ